MKSSKVPGVIAYARLKPSTSVSSTHSCRVSATSVPEPTMRGPIPPISPHSAISRTFHSRPSAVAA
ncbi:Uncharacterised protein [Mycobacteroides abscessus subsp. abscessus]|nr:Uncharacterised protein [Mycobacteroides abscessus subsp. abscessus]